MVTITLRNIWLSYLFMYRRVTPDLKKTRFIRQFIADKM